MEKRSKIVASHQPHFFPWLGYYDKMAKADLFLINDVAQLERKSPMVRNKILDREGKERFINVIVDKSMYMEKQNREILLLDWGSTKKTLIGKIKDGYFQSEYFDEIWPLVEAILENDYNRLIDLDIETIEMGRRCLDISTPIVFQSSLTYKEGKNTSEKLAEKLASVDTKIYLSGIGGKKYMDLSDYSNRGINVVFQTFSYPIYSQISSETFIPNLSFLDFIFNCGINKSREIFWENVHSSKEIMSLIQG